MKNKKILLIIILGFVLLIGGAAVLYNQLSPNVKTDQLADQYNQQNNDKSETEEKTKAPDFVVYDRQGNEVRLSDYIGKPVVINFWASWCGPCKMEMPDFNEKYSEFDGKVQFMMINMTDGKSETVESASEFILENNYTFPVFYDTDSDAAYNYGVYSIPTTLFIDKDGYFVAQATGAIDAQTLQKGIDMIIE